MDTSTLSQEQKDKLFDVSYGDTQIKASITILENGVRFNTNLIKTLQEQIKNAEFDLGKYSTLLPEVTKLAEAYTPPVEQVS